MSKLPVTSTKNLKSKIKTKALKTKSTLAQSVKLLKIKRQDFLSRRPHRSFKLSSKIDYYRPLQIEGYFAFSRQVLGYIFRHRNFFGRLLLLGCLSIVILTGVMSSSTYNNLKLAIEETTKTSENSQLKSDFYKTGLMFISTISTGGFNVQADSSQWLAIGLIMTLLVLASIYYSRNNLAGHQPLFRAVIYNCGAPIVAMIVIGFVMFLQLVPLFLYIILFSSALMTGVISGGVAAMMFYILGGLVVVLTLYLLSSSFLALIITTLPGMTPSRALQAAGDMVIGRRLKLIYRILWQMLQVTTFLVFIGVPSIALESWLSSKLTWLSSVPVVQLLFLIMIIFSLIWSTVYVYFLYRRIIEDESQPA